MHFLLTPWCQFGCVGGGGRGCVFKVQGFLGSFSRIHLSRETGSFVIINLHQKACWKVKQERGLFLMNRLSRYKDIKETDQLSGTLKTLKEKTYLILKYSNWTTCTFCLHPQIIRLERSKYIATFVVRFFCDIHRKICITSEKKSESVELLCESLLTVKFSKSCVSMRITWGRVVGRGWDRGTTLMFQVLPWMHLLSLIPRVWSKNSVRGVQLREPGDPVKAGAVHKAWWLSLLPRQYCSFLMKKLSVLNFSWARS